MTQAGPNYNRIEVAYIDGEVPSALAPWKTSPNTILGVVAGPAGTFDDPDNGVQYRSLGPAPLDTELSRQVLPGPLQNMMWRRATSSTPKPRPPLTEEDLVLVLAKVREVLTEHKMMIPDRTWPAGFDPRPAIVRNLVAWAVGQGLSANMTAKLVHELFGADLQELVQLASMPSPYGPTFANMCLRDRDAANEAKIRAASAVVVEKERNTQRDERTCHAMGVIAVRAHITNNPFPGLAPSFTVGQYNTWLFPRELFVGRVYAMAAANGVELLGDDDVPGGPVGQSRNVRQPGRYEWAIVNACWQSRVGHVELRPIELAETFDDATLEGVWRARAARRFAERPMSLGWYSGEYIRVTPPRMAAAIFVQGFLVAPADAAVHLAAMRKERVGETKPWNEPHMGRPEDWTELANEALEGQLLEPGELARLVVPTHDEMNRLAIEFPGKDPWRKLLRPVFAPDKTPSSADIETVLRAAGELPEGSVRPSALERINKIAERFGFAKKQISVDGQRAWRFVAHQG
jgi:hypothetical protein